MTLNKIKQWIEQINEKITVLHVILASLLFTILSIVYHQGGMLHPEMYVRLPFYLSAKPILNKIFDSNILDVGLFRARELSYFLDFLDIKLIELSVKLGFPHFLSLIHYLFAIIISCLIWQFCVKDLNLAPLIGMGWVFILWTSPTFFLGGDMFRDGKIAVVLLTAILFRDIYRIAKDSTFENSPPVSKKFWWAYFLALFAMTLLDEQGVYLNITILVFLSIWWIFFRRKEIFIALAISTASLVLHLLYRFLIAPALTLALNGYWPLLTYQQLPQNVNAFNFGHYLSNGLLLYLDTFRYLIGNPPQPVALVILLLLILFPAVYLYTRKDLSTDKRKIFSLTLIELLITTFFMVIAMNSGMIAMHPPLMWPGSGLVYYWLPTDILFLMTLLVLVSAFINSHFPKWILTLAIFAAIIGNIFALPKDKTIMLQGDLSKYYQSSPALLSAIKNIGTSEETQDSTILSNPVYQFFSKEAVK